MTCGGHILAKFAKNCMKITKLQNFGGKKVRQETWGSGGDPPTLPTRTNPAYIWYPHIYIYNPKFNIWGTKQKIYIRGTFHIFLGN